MTKKISNVADLFRIVGLQNYLQFEVEHPICLAFLSVSVSSL